MTERACPECGGELVPGRRRDKGDSFSVGQEAWLPGEPKKEMLGWFSGKGEAIPVITYACAKCGRLVSYLNRE
jgi:hypothetical protein